MPALAVGLIGSGTNIALSLILWGGGACLERPHPECGFILDREDLSAEPISSDARYLDRMSTRRQNLLDLLFRRHGKELLAYAGQRSGSEFAEDPVQDAYLRLLQHPAIESIDNPRAYLYRITANLNADQFRKSRVRGEVSVDDETELASVVCPRAAPDEETDHHFRLRRCLDALETLPEIYRHVFLLHRVDGLTHAEIASALQLPRRTVERYCAKALARCHSVLAGDDV